MCEIQRLCWEDPIGDLQPLLWIPQGAYFPLAAGVEGDPGLKLGIDVKKCIVLSSLLGLLTSIT